MKATPCAVPGCPHRLRLFTLAWPWRCPVHQYDHELEHRIFLISSRTPHHFKLKGSHR